MFMEQLLALIVFVGFLAFSLYGHWTSARRAKTLDRARRGAPALYQVPAKRRIS